MSGTGTTTRAKPPKCTTRKSRSPTYGTSTGSGGSGAAAAAFARSLGRPASSGSIAWRLSPVSRLSSSMRCHQNLPQRS